MSLVIVLYVREGIVMASDSRLTLNATQQRQGQQVTHLAVGQSDTNNKTFLAKGRIGISICGQADIQGIPISGYIESFINTLRKNVSVTTLPRQLLNYFRGLHGPPRTLFYVAGYKNNNQGIPQQHLYFVDIHNNTSVRKNNPNRQGAEWGGEIDVLIRLIQPVWLRAGQPGHYSYRPIPHHSIQWGYFTLQDAIDYAIYAIKTTIDTMRFHPRAKTIGGPIDVLVIKPNEAFFIQRKELHGNIK